MVFIKEPHVLLNLFCYPERFYLEPLPLVLLTEIQNFAVEYTIFYTIESMQSMNSIDSIYGAEEYSKKWL